MMFLKFRYRLGYEALSVRWVIRSPGNGFAESPSGHGFRIRRR